MLIRFHERFTTVIAYCGLVAKPKLLERLSAQT